MDVAAVLSRPSANRFNSTRTEFTQVLMVALHREDLRARGLWEKAVHSAQHTYRLPLAPLTSPAAFLEHFDRLPGYRKESVAIDVGDLVRSEGTTYVDKNSSDRWNSLAAWLTPQTADHAVMYLAFLRYLQSTCWFLAPVAWEAVRDFRESGELQDRIQFPKKPIAPHRRWTVQTEDYAAVEMRYILAMGESTGISHHIPLFARREVAGILTSQIRTHERFSTYPQAMVDFCDELTCEMGSYETLRAWVHREAVRRLEVPRDRESEIMEFVRSSREVPAFDMVRAML